MYFFEAIAHSEERHRVLGCELRPLSLWHELLLETVESPFAQKASEAQAKYRSAARDRELKFRSLFQAAEICRLLPPHLPEADSFRARRRRRCAFRRFYQNATIVDLIRQEVLFLNYLADHRSEPILGRPIVSSKDKAAEPVKSPHWLYQAELFCRFHPEVPDRPSLGEKSVWAMSPGEVAWANIASQEAHGLSVNIATEAIIRTVERVRRRQAEVSTAKKNGNG